jgi:glycosyltransferase involved in cell wall biosynthesis
MELKEGVCVDLPVDSSGFKQLHVGKVRPAISVMMVCYNSAHTLPWAFGSLLAQGFVNWECIFVDDGSSDGSYDVAVGLGDPRIRAFRFNTNRGRGTVRQFALEQAKGDYLCILDADDWMFPWRLQAEMDFLEVESETAVVSAGMAILDRAGELAGSRGCADGDRPRVFPSMTRLRMPPFSFPASMIRMSVARLYKFDPEILAEDTDYLMQIVVNHRYGVLDRNVYVYTEHYTLALGKYLEVYNSLSLMFHKFRTMFPLQSRINGLTVLLKSLVYRSAFVLKRSEWLIDRRRLVSPTPRDVEEFELARTTVALMVQNVFGVPL